jgi:hypothetical protein
VNGDEGAFARYARRAKILVDADPGEKRTSRTPMELRRRRRRRSPPDFFPPRVHGRSTSAPDVADSIIDVGKLEDAFKWAAGGFTAVAGLLVFFGIKEGVLDQALRLNAAATLVIFTLLGTGVVAALFAPAIVAASRIRLWAVLLALALIVGGTGFFLPDLGVFRAEQLELLRGESQPAGGALRPLLLVVLAALVLAVVVGVLVSYAERADHRRTAVVAAVLSVVAALSTYWLTKYLFFSIDESGDGGSAQVGLQGAAGNLVTVVGVVAALSVIAWAFAQEKALPTVAGLVLIAVGATSTGLYAATKLAVQSKMLAVVPQVTGVIEDSNTGSVLVIHARAGRMRGYGLVVWTTGQVRAVAGVPARRTADGHSAGDPRDVATTVRADDNGVVAAAPAPLETLWEAVLRPDALDEVDRNVKVPIVPQRWESLTVRYCLADTIQDTPTCIADTEEAVAVIRNRASEVGIGQVTGAISPRGGDLVARFAATDIAPGVSIRVAVCRTVDRRHGGRLTMATLAPGTGDTVRWRTVIPDDPSADRWTLLMQTYPPGNPSTQSWRRVATYKP